MCSNFECFECTEDSHCNFDLSKPNCDTLTTNACVECVDNGDCLDAESSKCESNNECIPCSTHIDC